jgi:predicted dehydrogenase
MVTASSGRANPPGEPRLGEDATPSPKAPSSLTRRDFVRAAFGGAGLALAAAPVARAQTAPASAAPATGTATRKIRYALIGLGAQGRVLLDALQKIGNIELVAIVDIWPYTRNYTKNLLTRSGIKVNTYESTDEMLAAEKDLEAAIVATPDFWHAPVTNQCLRAGLHVYCEKMMSNTIAGARSMVATMRETGKLLQIGHQRRSNPRYRFALNRLLNDAKICGKLTAAQAQWNRAASPDLGWPKKSDMPPELLSKYGFESMHQFRNWRWFKALGGGPLSDLGAHQIDIFPWFLGVYPKTVMASGGVDYYKGRECVDNAMVIYEFPMPDGATVRAFYQVQTTTSAGGGYFEYFMGDQGSLKMSENPRLCVLYREASAPDWSPWVGKNYLRAQPAPVAAPSDTAVDVRETAPLQSYDIPVTFAKAIHQPHLENFFNAIRGTATLTCPADEAYRSEYIIHKANEALEARQILQIKPEEFEV